MGCIYQRLLILYLLLSASPRRSFSYQGGRKIPRMWRFGSRVSYQCASLEWYEILYDFMSIAQRSSLGVNLIFPKATMISVYFNPKLHLMLLPLRRQYSKPPSIYLRWSALKSCPSISESTSNSLLLLQRRQLMKRVAVIRSSSSCSWRLSNSLRTYCELRHQQMVC